MVRRLNPRVKPNPGSWLSPYAARMRCGIVGGLAAVLELVVLLGCGPVGPKIREFDLDKDVQRQVTVDREEGVYLGHVSSVTLSDGKTILISYPKGHGKGPIVLKRTTDGGKTWSERLPTPESWQTSQETPTLFRLRDPKDGHSRLVLFSGLFPIRMARSEDDGATWTQLEPVGEWGGIVAMGFVHQFEDGRAIAMFHDDGRFIRFGGTVSRVMTLYQTESSDGGLTWTVPKAVFASEQVNLCEPGLVVFPDSGRLAVLLRENRRLKNSHVIFSSDQGKTWTQPQELPAALTGDRHIARFTPDGRLVVVMRDMAKDSPTKGDWVMWVGSCEDLVKGGEGQYRVRLKDNLDSWDCAYSGLERLSDGSLLAISYGHWTRGQQPYILSVRIATQELDRMAKDQP